MKYKILQWDTDNFGFPVAAMHPVLGSQSELLEIIEMMKGEGIRLAYLFSTDRLDSSVEKIGARLVDEKTEFCFDFYV